MDVDGSSAITVDCQARRAHKADGEHANGKAEKGAKDELLAEPDVDFPEQADWDCNDWERRVSIVENVDGSCLTN